MSPVVQKNIIRGPNLEVVRTSSNGLTPLAAYLLVDDITRAFSKGAPPKNPGLRAAFDAAAPGQTGLALPSNKRMSKALVETSEWESINPAFPLWTGTMAAYAEPDTPFNKSRMFSRNDNALVYSVQKSDERWIFLLSAVPQACQNASYVDCLEGVNVILVAEPSLYSLETRDRDIVITPRVVEGLCEFPTKSGWYLGKTEHDIPLGEPVSSKVYASRTQETRYLQRFEDAGRVGFVSRTSLCNSGGNFRRSVDLGRGPFWKLGVAVEAPEDNPATFAVDTGRG